MALKHYGIVPFSFVKKGTPLMGGKVLLQSALGKKGKKSFMFNATTFKIVNIEIAL